MKTFSIAFVILLLIGIFAPRDSLLYEIGGDANALFESEEVSVYIPFKTCTSMLKENNKCFTLTVDQDLNVNSLLFFLLQGNVGEARAACEAFPPEARNMCANNGYSLISYECSSICKDRINDMMNDIRQEYIENGRILEKDRIYDMTFDIREGSLEYAAPDRFNRSGYSIRRDEIIRGMGLDDSYHFAYSLWDPVNNPDDLAREIDRRDSIPFWDSWINVSSNAVYLAKEYKLTTLLIMSLVALALTGALFIIQIAVTVISGGGAKKDGRFKTGFKDNITTADAVQSVQGPLSKLNPLRDASFMIGTLCYLPFMISIPLLIPGSFASHLVEVIYFYFVVLFMGGLYLATMLPIYIIFAIYSLAIGEPMPDLPSL